MATRRKLKKQVYFVIGGLILIIIAIVFGISKYQEYKYHQTYEYKLLEHGYNDEEVTKRVKKLSEELKSKYGVIHLTITGSFAKKTYTQYSDLDVILDMSDYKKIAEAEAFIQEKIKIPVDAIQANDSFTRLSDLQTYRIEVF